MKRRNITKIALAAIFSALFALGAVSAVSATSAPPESLVYSEGFGRTRVRINKAGEYRIDKNAKTAEVGQTEFFAVRLKASENAETGERAMVTVESEAYDFTKCEPLLLIPVDDVYYVRYLTNYVVTEHSVTAPVSVEYLGVNPTSPVLLYVSAKKTEATGKAYVTVERELKTTFDYGENVFVGDYIISKQGGAFPAQFALGISGMNEEDTVYIVSDSDGAEILRLVVQDGRLIGIGKKDGELIIGLEYSVKDKCYVSTLTRKKLLDRDAVVEVFKALDVSFANDPDEKEWLAEQKSYRTRKGILIK